MRELKNDICLMFEKECRFVSNEFTYRPFTEIKKENGVYKPIAQGKKKCSVGQICNTHEIGKTPWVEQMNTCPVLWSRARYGKIPVAPNKKKSSSR